MLPRMGQSFTSSIARERPTAESGWVNRNAESDRIVVGLAVFALKQFVGFQIV